ncbi:MAG: hypothetical protein R3Y32_03900 [Bacillota bacterium]
MENYQPQIGRVCKAISGRDEGRNFIIYAIIDEEYVLIVDGKTRLLAKPKKKKIKHLKLRGEVMDKIAEKIIAEKLLHDPEIKSALRAFNIE